MSGRDDLLPPKATPLEQALAGAGARMSTLDSDAIRRERRPADCSAAFVPFLAWERSVHFYDPVDEAGNRARVESAFEDHLNYGSPDALQAEIALETGQNVKLVEFWQERDLVWPYFIVESVIAPGDAPPDLDAVWASAVKRKNTRDMPKVRTRVVQPPALRAVGAAHHVSIRITPAATTPILPHVGAVQRLLPKIQVRPL
jgi:phage tail P2-like protein